MGSRGLARTNTLRTRARLELLFKTYFTGIYACAISTEPGYHTWWLELLYNGRSFL